VACKRSTYTDSSSVVYSTASCFLTKFTEAKQHQVSNLHREQPQQKDSGVKCAVHSGTTGRIAPLDRQSQRPPPSSCRELDGWIGAQVRSAEDAG